MTKLVRVFPMLLAAAVLSGSEPADRQAVSKLVSRLNAATRAERDEAERTLLKLGPDVLEHLPTTSPDPATRAALSRVRETLHKRRATESVTRPRRVSIAGRGPLEEVAADWLNDNGFPRIALSPNQRRRPVAIEVRDVAYWKAIDRLAEKAGLWPNQFGPTRGLTFRERTPADARVRLDYPGAFRVASGPVSIKDLPGNSGKVLYRLALEIRAEPDLRPLYVMHSASTGMLTGGSGAQIKAFTPGASYELPMGEAGGVARLRLDFAGPRVAGPLTFSGEFVATVASRDIPFAFDVPRGRFERQEKEHGGVTVRLQNVDWHKDGSVTLAIAVVYADGSAFESYRTWVYHNDAVLAVERANGEILILKHEPSFETVAQSPGALVLRYTFEDVPDKTRSIRFRYRAPADVINVPLNVNLEGLTVTIE